ncbi:hypothetical protein PSAC2689_100149 [Paraburkholderia sacchari]
MRRGSAGCFANRGFLRTARQQSACQRQRTIRWRPRHDGRLRWRLHGRRNEGLRYGWPRHDGRFGYDCGVDHVGWDPGLKLSHDQQTRMNAIVDQSRKAHWLPMGKMLDEQSALRDLYTATRQPSTPVTPRCATCASRCTGSLSTNTSVSMHCLPASSANGCATTDAKWKPPECGPA